MNDGAKTWLTWLAVTMQINAIIWFAFPRYVSSDLYDIAEVLAPFWVWGIFSCFGGLVCLYARVKEARVVAVLGMSMSMWTQFIFGLSILAVSLQGLEVAVTGTIQWWASAFISLWFLRRGVSWKSGPQ